MVMGDFNVNLLHADNGGCANFLNLMYASGFFPIIFRPTHITKYSATLFNNIFVNYPNFSNSGLIYFDISDHLGLPLFVTLPVNNKQYLIKNDALINTK